MNEKASKTPASPSAQSTDSITLFFHVDVIDLSNDEINTLWFDSAADMINGLMRRLDVCNTINLVDQINAIGIDEVHAAKNPLDDCGLIVAASEEELVILAKQLADPKQEMLHLFVRAIHDQAIRDEDDMTDQFASDRLVEMETFAARCAGKLLKTQITKGSGPFVFETKLTMNGPGAFSSARSEATSNMLAKSSMATCW